MKWLITGGTGFVGSNLAASLLADGNPDNHQIIALDNFSESSFDEYTDVSPLDGAVMLDHANQTFNTNHKLGVVEGDIRDEDLMDKLISEADIVIHLAANTGVGPSVANPRRDCEMNILGTLNLLEAARKHGIQRFVFASSGAPAGICEPPITENIAPRPASPYGASKLAGEGYCSAYSVAFGVPTVALRFSNIYGPRSWRKGSVVATFIRQAMKGEPLTINGDGSQTRDFIYIDDLVHAIRLAATTPDLTGEVFQVATGQETSVNELLVEMSKQMSEMGINLVTPKTGVRTASDVLRNFADASKARKAMGWEPKVSLPEGLARTLAWFKSQ